MVKKAEKLVKNADFKFIYARGRSFVNPYVVLYIIPNQLALNKVGFSVSKKLGSAVVRNRVKRLLREIYRLNRAKIRPGFNLVFVARVRARDADFWQLCKACVDLLERAGLFQQNPEDDGVEKS